MGWALQAQAPPPLRPVEMEEEAGAGVGSGTAEGTRGAALPLSQPHAQHTSRQHKGAAATSASAQPAAAPEGEKHAGGREDCWSEAATFTLIDAWGSHYVELNRGNLKQKHWKEVAEAVNLREGGKASKTDVQCKNRLDTLKKKYKTEKNKLLEAGANGGGSKWPFFRKLDDLIGTSRKHKKQQQQQQQQLPTGDKMPASHGSKVPRRPVAAKEAAVAEADGDPKPPSHHHHHQPQPPSRTASTKSKESPDMTDSCPHAYGDDDDDGVGGGLAGLAGLGALGGAAAALGAAVGAAARATDGGVGTSERATDVKSLKKRKLQDGPFKDLARAIIKFGEVYERIESAKQRQLTELEKQRMEFTKDLEMRRMELFMQTQVELAKLKRCKHGGTGNAAACACTVRNLIPLPLPHSSLGVSGARCLCCCQMPDALLARRCFQCAGLLASL